MTDEPTYEELGARLDAGNEARRAQLEQRLDGIATQLNAASVARGNHTDSILSRIDTLADALEAHLHRHADPIIDPFTPEPDPPAGDPYPTDYGESDPTPEPPAVDPQPEPDPQPPVEVELPTHVHVNPWGMDDEQVWEGFGASHSFLNKVGHDVYGALTRDEVTDPGRADNGPHPDGNFRFQAAPSHFGYGCPANPAAPLMMYAGNTETTPSSTGESLSQRGGSTVQGRAGANRSAYWMPALLTGPADDPATEVVLPRRWTIYYKSKGAVAEKCQPIPNDLLLLGGNFLNAWMDDDKIYRREAAAWGWRDPSNDIVVDVERTIPEQDGTGRDLRCVIGFPQIIDTDNMRTPGAHEMLETKRNGAVWDQDQLDVDGYRIAHLQMLLDFDTEGRDTSTWQLSTDQPGDRGRSLYGGVLFAWNPMVEKAWLEGAIHARRNASEGQLGTIGHGLDGLTLRRIQDVPGRIKNQHYIGPKFLPMPAVGGRSDD